MTANDELERNSVKLVLEAKRAMSSLMVGYRLVINKILFAFLWRDLYESILKREEK
jgi:hypothetical protein